MLLTDKVQSLSLTFKASQEHVHRVSLYQQNLQLRCCAKPSSLFLLAMCTIRDRHALSLAMGAGWCVLCLSASPYSWISFPQKPEPKGGWRYLYAAALTREHLALAPWGLGRSQGMRTDPLAWKHSWGHQNRCSLSVLILTVSASAARSPHPSVSLHTLPVSYPHCLPAAQLTPSLLSLSCHSAKHVSHVSVPHALALGDSCSSCVKTQPDNTLSRARTIWMSDLLIQHHVLLNSQQIRGQISVANYSAFLSWLQTVYFCLGRRQPPLLSHPT